MKVLAIDPGPVQSAFVLYEDGTVYHHGIVPNIDVLDRIVRSMGDNAFAGWNPFAVVIEMIASYGMPVGAEVFETCVWIGRFIQVTEANARMFPKSRPVVERMFRRDVKLHLCGQARAKDGNVRQALIDKFGPGKDVAIGTKKAPGPLFGIRADEWAALAVAVTFVETIVDKRREARKEKAA